jgi:hypothetical protein
VAVRQSKGLRVNYLIIFLSGLVLLILGILVFLLVIRNVYGNYEIKEILPTENNISLLTFDKQKKAALLYSQYTQNMMPEGSTWLSDNVDTWETFLRNENVKFDVISDENIENGEHMDYKMLILPGSKSLSDKELLQIKKYLEKGGSVFATSGTATYSDEGKWRGWNFFTEVYGISFTTEIKPEETFKVHTLRGNLPLTAGIPTGYTLNIATWDRPIYAEILEPRTTQVSFWYDFRREAGLVREEIKKSAGISYGTYGNGRFVWYGFELNSVVGKREDYIYFEKLFINSINWLTYNPTAYVKDWPAPYDAALVFIPTLSKDIYNINNILPSLNTYRFPATFFVDPFVAVKNKSLVRNLSKYGDVGALVDVGYLESATDTVNKLYDKDVQYSSLKYAVDSLSKITNSNIKSLMPLNGFYDENTLQAMSKENFEFLITDSLTDRSVPKTIVRDEKPILLITKTARDDYEVVRDYGLKDTEFQKYTYIEDIDRLLFEGGLYVFKVHTNYQLQPQYSGVVNDVMRYARNHNIWITSLPALRTWWLRKNRVELRYESRSKRRITLEVTNPSNKKSENIVVQVHLNKKIKNLQVSSDIINTEIPEYRVDMENQVIYLYISELDSHETRSYLLDFENVNS